MEDDLAGVTLYTWDPTTNDYITPAELCMGKGYWIWFDEEAVVDIIGHEFNESIQEIPCITPGWHMIGPSFLVSWGDAQVAYSGETLSIDQAAKQGWIKSFVIRYNPDISEDYYYWCGYEEAILAPWCGYWIKTLVPDVTLQLQENSAYYASTLTLNDPRTMGFQLPKAGMALPPPPPKWTSETEVGWWVASATGSERAVFQIAGPQALQAEAVRLKVFNLAGDQVYEEQAPGCRLTWRYVASSGERLTNGVYLVQISAQIDGIWEDREVIKLLILR